MAIIRSKEGNIAFSAKGKALITGITGTSPADYAAPRAGNDEIEADVAIWGTDNNLPGRMMQDIEATGVLSAGIDTKARIAIGKGPMPARITGYTEDGYEQLEFVADAEIQDWLDASNSFENSYASVLDLLKAGNNFRQILMSTDRKIIGYKRQDPCECRFSKSRDLVYMSGDWTQFTNKGDKEHFAKVPLLSRDFPLLDLQSRTKDYSFMVATQYPLFGRKYYAPSPWYVAKKWVDIVKAIPQMKAKMFENQMTIKYVVDIHPNFWVALNPKYKTMSDADKEKFEDDWFDSVEEFLVGNDNAYKSMFNRLVYDEKSQQWVQGVKITPLDDKIKDGKLIPDAAAGSSEILFAISLNPALVGLSIPGAGTAVTSGSGSNIREAFLVQIMQLEVERRLDAKIFDMAKITNGWQQRLGKGQPLVLRYPNQILTTLNTGKNTQPTA